MTALIALLLLIFGGAADAQVVSPTLPPPNVVVQGGTPNGAPPQIIGYSATNTPESETVVGDMTFARTGTNQYTATVTSVGGVAFGPLATLNAGTGLSTNATTLSLTVPVAIINGGTGTTTAPTTPGQLLISQSTSTYAAKTLTGDATITSAGAMTVSKINGVTIGGTCSAGQFFSGLNSSGVPTCTTPAITGIPNGGPPQFIGYSAPGSANAEAETLGGGSGACTFTRTSAGAYQLNCSYASSVSPTFSGTVTLPDGSTWTNTGLTGGTASFTTLNPTTVNATTINVNNSAGKYTAVNGAVYQQPGYNGTTLPAYWDINGFQQVEAIGIGQAIGADPIDITKNQNAATLVTALNNSNAASATVGFVANNGTNTASLKMQGTGNSTNPNTGVLWSDQGLIYDTHNGQQQQFEINDTLVGYFATNGLHLVAPLEIASGGLGTSTSPTLGQVPYASTAGHYVPTSLTSNTLSDTVAPGLWAPTLGFWNGSTCNSTGWAYSTTTHGWYTEIGKIVVSHFYIAVTTKGTGSGAVCIVFPVTGYAYTVQMENFISASNVNTLGGVTGLSLSMGSNTNAALIYQQIFSGGASSSSVLTDTGITSSSILQGTLVYTAL